jgi:hypothetical protein
MPLWVTTGETVYGMLERDSLGEGIIWRLNLSPTVKKRVERISSVIGQFLEDILVY